MVWQERGKFGVHNGRTMRAPSLRWGSGTDFGAESTGEIGYVSKVVTKLDSNLTDEEMQCHLAAFPLADGFDNKAVLKASTSRKFERFSFNKGYESEDVVLSLKKRKRWLMPELLRESFEENFAKSCLDSGENQGPRVVLIERQATKEVGKHRRVRRGDCISVLDSHGMDTAPGDKRSQLAHVGDLYKASQDAEVVYEVASSVASHVWPNHQEISTYEFDLSESRTQTKSKCKIKGTRYKKRLWGDYRTSELNSKDVYNDTLHLNDCYHDNDDRYTVQTEDLQCMGDTGADFDIGTYITDCLNKTAAKGDTYMKYNNYTRSCSSYNSKASLQSAKLHGKGSAIFVDQDSWKPDNEGQITVIIAEGEPVYNENKIALQKDEIFVRKESIQPDQLKEDFGERYKEGQSIPRKFSITPVLLKDVYLLFEPIMTTKYIYFLPLTVTVICNAKTDAMFSDESISDVVQYFERDLTDAKQRNITDNENQKRMRKTVVAYDVLNEVCGYTTKAVGLPMAFDEIQGLGSTESQLTETTDVRTPCVDQDDVYCEVCYDVPVSTDGLTSLTACHHWICNSCWHAYLTVQAQQGIANILCPAHNCKVPVDKTTFMALAPEVFLKYIRIQRHKAVDGNPEWSWCPRNTCGCVAKVNRDCKKGQTNSLESGCLPVTCCCGLTWCFECQAEPHWPASCNMAQKFRQQTKAYQEILNSNRERIKSVFVKRCPACRYPVEKDGGCPHMSCTMCGGHFCWECLKEWNLHGYGGAMSCVGENKEEEVELTSNIGSARYNRNVRVAVAHCQARRVQVMFKMYQHVEAITKAVAFHQRKHPVSLNPTGKPPSSTLRLLQRLSEHSIQDTYKRMVDFKFLSHAVIEGCAVIMAMSRSSLGHKQLQRNIGNLQFIISRLEDYADNVTKKLCSVEAVQAVRFLLDTGCQCMVDIGRVAQLIE